MIFHREEKTVDRLGKRVGDGRLGKPAYVEPVFAGGRTWQNGVAGPAGTLERKGESIPRSWIPRPVIGVLVVLSLAAPGSYPRAQQVYFHSDVAPVLTRLGCNGGGCHGKATGQNGFKLSLLGYEPDLDYEAIVQEARGRRLFPAAPWRSLLLRKATGSVAHGGGKRTDVGSEDYQTLLRWIERGAPPATPSDPVLRRITVTPYQRVLDPGARRQPLRVTACYSDGTSRDVTRQAVYQSNEPDIAQVSDTGVVQAGTRCGLFAVMVRYGDQMTVFQGTVPH